MSPSPHKHELCTQPGDAGNPAAAARTVISHDGVSDVRNGLEVTLPVDPATMGAAAHTRGASIGRFVVIEALGQGAMGIVLGAYDPDLDRKVALKLLRPGAYGASSVEGRERLKREARAMAKLSHPNVLTIHEVGEIEGGLFLATELAAGGTLHAWRLAEPRGWQQILHKYLLAGRGLAAAHAAGLVHRDFKPTNVLLDKDDTPRVADFGLVVMGSAAPTTGTDAPASSDITLTETGTMLGTPAYMAPEQHGRGEVGPAADQFAFCVAMWEALHDAPPFEGTTAVTIADNVRANRVIEPRDSEVPEWLRIALRRGFAVDPADRWPSMDALLAELSRDPAAERSKRLAIGAAIASVVVIAGVIGYLVTRGAGETQCENMDRQLAGIWDPARAAAVRAAFAKSDRPQAADTFERFAKQLDAYTEQWVDARRTACEATRVHGDQSAELLDLKVACLDRRLIAVDALVDVYSEPPAGDALDRAVSSAFALAPLEPCADAEALRAAFPPPTDAVTRDRVGAARQQIASAKALAESGQYPRARNAGREALTAAEATRYAPVLAEALHRQATLERLAGDAKAAEALLERALIAGATARDDVLVAEIWSELVYVVGHMLGRPAEAMKMKTPATAALKRANDDAITEGNMIANFGRVLMVDSKWAEAQKTLEQALVIKERTSGPDSHDVARLLISLATTYQEQGNLEEALVHIERALAIFKATYGPEHPMVAGTLNNRATVYEAQGKYEESLAGHQQVLAMMIRMVGDDHPYVADSYQNIGQTYRVMGKLDLAREHIEKALAIQRVKLGEDHPELAQNIVNLGILDMDLDRFESARAHFEHAVKIFEAAKLETGTEAGYAINGLASALYSLGRYPEALAMAERLYKLREAEDGQSINLTQAKFALGRALLATGRDQPRALALLAKARTEYQTEGGPMLQNRLQLVEDALAKHKR
jgi:tetratricopeptide (TPR) repeat protein/tRNA A-37 threonylcarbamoyl transferase component Bud32